MAYLLIREGTYAGQYVQLTNNLTVLGRDGNVDLVIREKWVRRRHAIITHPAGRYFNEDGDGAGREFLTRFARIEYPTQKPKKKHICPPFPCCQT